MKILFTIILLVLFINAFAGDSVVVRKDPRLDILTARQISVNKVTARMTSNGQYRGYRLQVLITRSRDDAFKAKAELLQDYPEEKSYVLFQSPNFKVRFGNFTDRAGAEKYRKLLSSDYPDGVFVVEDTIDYTPGDDTTGQ